MAFLLKVLVAVSVLNLVSLFIQACRGQGLDAGVEVCDSDDTQDETDAGKLRRIPSMADFLLAYSVVPGKSSDISGAGSTNSFSH